MLLLCVPCTGFVSCGVVVLLADLVLKRGPYYSASGIARLFQVVALQTCIGLAAAAAMLRRNWKRLAAAGPPGSYGSGGLGINSGSGFGRSGSDKQIIGLAVGSVAAGGLRAGGVSGLAGGSGLRHRSDLPVCTAEQTPAVDASSAAVAGIVSNASEGTAPAAAVAIHLGAEQVAAAAVPLHGSSRGSSGGRAANKAHFSAPRALRRLLARCTAATDQLLVLFQVAFSIWPAALGLLLSVGSSMLAFPFFTFVPHTGAFAERLPQVGGTFQLIQCSAGRHRCAGLAATTSCMATKMYLVHDVHFATMGSLSCTCTCIVPVLSVARCSS
jgi:hypothetical protein